MSNGRENFGTGAQIAVSVANPVLGAILAVTKFITGKPSQSKADRGGTSRMGDFLRATTGLDFTNPLPSPREQFFGRSEQPYRRKDPRLLIRELPRSLPLLFEREGFAEVQRAADAAGFDITREQFASRTRSKRPGIDLAIYRLVVGAAELGGFVAPTPEQFFPRIGSSRTQGAWFGLAAGLAPLALESLPVPAGELDTARAFAGTSPIPEILVVAPAALPALLPALGRAAGAAFGALARGRSINPRGRGKAEKPKSEFDELIQSRTIEPGRRARPPARRAPPAAPMPLTGLDDFLRPGAGGAGAIPEIIVTATRPGGALLPNLAAFAGSVASVLPELTRLARPPTLLAPSSSPAAEPASSTRTAPAPGTSVSVGPSLSALIGAGNALFGRPGRGFSFQPGAEFAALPGLQTQTATAGQGDGGDVCRVVCSAPRKRRKGKPKKCFTPGQLGAYVRSKRKSA